MLATRKISEWEGPIKLVFSLCSVNHHNTVRYQKSLKKRNFDFYVPRALLLEDGTETVPQELIVIIRKSLLPIRTIGNGSQPIPPRTTDQFWEYEFSEENVNSVRFNVMYGGKRYSLYIPNEIFEGYRYPDRVRIQVIVPDYS